MIKATTNVKLTPTCCPAATIHIEAGPRAVFNAFFNGIPINGNPKTIDVPEGTQPPPADFTARVVYEPSPKGIKVTMTVSYRDWVVKREKFVETT